MKNLPDFISEDQINNIIDSVGEDIAHELLKEVFAVYSEDALVIMKRFEDSIHDKDLQEFHKVAHHLKGASSNLGLNEIAALCQFLEKYTGAFPSSEITTSIQDLTLKFDALNVWIAEAFNNS
ncbi:Hpt domain-containing protein [bacterium]|nr:Hpt domain-containing protein [bacterium]